MEEQNLLPIMKVSKRSNGTLRVQTEIPGKSLADQSTKDDCDVNKIMAKYEKTGTLTHLRNAAEGVYADLSQLPSYREAVEVVRKAEDAFMEIPAQIRNRFENDPQQLIAFLADSKNDQEAYKLGLKIEPKKPEVPAPAAPADEPKK